MFRHARIMVAGMGLLLLLSGCIKLEITTEINGDETGTNSFIMGFDKTLMDAEATALLEETRSAAEQAGAVVEDYEDSEYVGLEVVFHFDNLTEMAEQLTTDFSGIGVDEGAAGGGFLDDVVAYRAGDELHVSMTLVSEGESFGVDEDVSISLIMPGAITSYTEQDIASRPSSRKVVWRPDMEVARTYELAAVSGISAVPSLDTVIRGAVVGGGILLLLALVVLAVRRRPRRIGGTQPIQRGALHAGSVTCPTCGAATAVGGRFCVHCGVPLQQPDAQPATPQRPARPPKPVACSNCGATIRPGSRFCGRCGAPQ